MALAMNNYEFAIDTGISLLTVHVTALTATQALKQAYQGYIAERAGSEPVEIYWVLRLFRGDEFYTMMEFLPGHSRFNQRNRKPHNYYAQIELRDYDWGILSNRVRTLPRKVSA
jgi:hypothetical protein